jgi:RING-box protein 2
METEEAKAGPAVTAPEGTQGAEKGERMFTLKKWNAVAMWSWDVECDTCAICRVQVAARGRVEYEDGRPG